MNTKILMQRLAKAASSKTKTSIAAIMIYSGALRFLPLPVSSQTGPRRSTAIQY
jgi:hypothetical protein